MTLDIKYGDCIEVMKGMPDKFYDLILTDPPYNVGMNYGSLTNDSRTDYLTWSKAWFNEAKRVSSSIIFTPGTVNLSMWLNEIEYPKGLAILHVPNQNSGSNLGGFNHWEPILVYGKICLKYNHFKMIVKHQDSAEGHPCPKQTEAFKDILAACHPKPKNVLDIFAGSGTTLRACRELDIDCSGIEINPAFKPIIENRALIGIPSLDKWCGAIKPLEVSSCLILNKNLLNCKQCGHKWQPRNKEPDRCPKCKSYYWNNEKKTILKIMQSVNLECSRTTYYYLKRLNLSSLIEDLKPKLRTGELKPYTAYRELQRREYLEAVKILEPGSVSA